MCCCTVPTCCCGCTPMKKGLLIYAIIDAFVELLFGILFVLIKIPVLGFWPFLMIIIDIVLAIGIHKENQCMVLIWMVFAMLYIIGGYISALILTLASGLLLAVESIGSSLCNGVQESVNFNFNSNNIGNSLNGFGNGGGSLNFGVNGGNNNNLDTFNAQSNG